MLFVTKGKKKKFVKTKLLPPGEQLLRMKILTANFVSYSWANCLNQHFEILNPVDYGWEISKVKLEPNWFVGSALPSIENIDQEQNNLDKLPHVNASTDNTFSNSEDKTEGLCFSDSNDDVEPY